MQIAIVLYPGLTALDPVGPYEVLRMLPGSEVRFVSHEAGPVVTDSGVLVLHATHSFAETPAPDVVLVPGSEADTTTAMADGRLLRWLRQAHGTSRWTAGVCSGTLVLAAAGLLEGRPATTHWIAQSRLRRFGAKPRPDARVVRSGKIFTGAGVSAGIDLALELAGEIAGPDQAEVIQLLIEYDPQPPFDSGHPRKARPEIRERARREMLRRTKNPRNALSIPLILGRRALGSLSGWRRRMTSEDDPAWAGGVPDPEIHPPTLRAAARTGVNPDGEKV